MAEIITPGLTQLHQQVPAELLEIAIVAFTGQPPADCPPDIRERLAYVVYLVANNLTASAPPINPTPREAKSPLLRWRLLNQLIIVRQIDTVANLPALTPGLHYAYRATALTPAANYIRQSLVLSLLANLLNKRVPVGVASGKLPELIVGSYTAAELEILYQHGINPITCKAGVATIWGQQLITPNLAKRVMLATRNTTLELSPGFLQLLQWAQDNYHASN